MRSDCFFDVYREELALARVSGVNDALTPIDAVDANAQDHLSRSDLIAQAESILDSLRPRGSLREFSACLDLIDALHGRLTVTEMSSAKWERMFGIRVPYGPYAAYALAP